MHCSAGKTHHKNRDYWRLQILNSYTEWDKMNHSCSPIKNSCITKTLNYHVKWILPFYKTYKKYTICDKLNRHISCGQFTNVRHIHSMYWRHGSISGYWLVNCAAVARAKDGAVHKVLGTNVPTWQDFSYVTGTFTDNTHHWHSNAILTFGFPRIFNVLRKKYNLTVNRWRSSQIYLSTGKTMQVSSVISLQ